MAEDRYVAEGGSLMVVVAVVHCGSAWVVVAECEEANKMTSS
jgi:hypothetical protein